VLPSPYLFLLRSTSSSLPHRSQPFPQYDFVFVDEAQDTDVLQRAIIQASLRSGGRLCAVGDPGQAIYGFRGAGTDSMTLLKAAFNAAELPLHVSFRCSRAVVSTAQEVYPRIEAAPLAAQGAVMVVETDDGLLGDEELSEYRPSPSDVILCRMNAPLVKQAYKLIAAGMGCRMLGRSLGSQLASLMDKEAAADLPALLGSLAARLVGLRAMQLEEQGSKAAETLEDQVECIKVVAGSLPAEQQTVMGLKAALRHLFDDKEGVVTLCSIHRAKGLEWSRVFVLKDGTVTTSDRTPSWRLQEEHNLRYVAITRAQDTLVRVMQKDASRKRGDD
jgi:DNA helicase-2/ATP-dependent DNA helicase PcrA